MDLGNKFRRKEESMTNGEDRKLLLDYVMLTLKIHTYMEIYWTGS